MFEMLLYNFYCSNGQAIFYVHAVHCISSIINFIIILHLGQHNYIHGIGKPSWTWTTTCRGRAHHISVHSRSTSPSVLSLDSDLRVKGGLVANICSITSLGGDREGSHHSWGNQHLCFYFDYNIHDIVYVASILAKLYNMLCTQYMHGFWLYM